MNKKKLLVVIVALIAIVAVMAACGGKGETGTETGNKADVTESNNITELVLGKLNTVEDVAELTLFKVATTEKITASLDGSFYYNNDNPDEIYVDMIFDVKNLGAENVSCDDFMLATAEGATGTKYSCGFYAVETDNLTNVSTFENIAPLGSARFHAAFSVPKEETELKIAIALGDEEFTFPYTVGNIERNATVLKAGDVIEAEDFANMTFKGIDYTDDLLPSNTSGFYTHYEVDNKDNTYLVVKYDIENFQGSAKDVDTFAGIKAVYMGKYTYTGFVVVEDSDKKGFSSYEQIDPLTKRACYCLIEVPKSVSEKEVELEISFNSQEYIYKG